MKTQVRQLGLFLLLWLAISMSYASRFQSIGARSLGLSNANITLSDVWSSNNNQAGLAFIKNTAFGVAYQNNFNQSELSLKALNGAIKTGIGGFGFSVQQFGFSDYNENKMGVGYGLKMSSKVSLGVQLNYHLISIAETQTPNKQGVSADLGLVAKPTEHLTIASHISNVSNATFLDNDEEKIPMHIKIGIGYSFSEKVLAVAEIDKNIDLKPNLKAGLEYHPIEALFFRAGINSYDSKMSFGLGYQYKGLQLDLATSYQTYLGYITQISLNYAIHKNK
jgi:hypothetical protein